MITWVSSSLSGAFAHGFFICIPLVLPEFLSLSPTLSSVFDNNIGGVAWCACVGVVINCCSLSDWRCYILLDTSAHMLWCLVQLWVPNKSAGEVWATRGTMQWLLHWLLLPLLLTSPADQRAPEPWPQSQPWYYSIPKLVPLKSWNCFTNSFLIRLAS